MMIMGSFSFHLSTNPMVYINFLLFLLLVTSSRGFTFPNGREWLGSSRFQIANPPRASHCSRLQAVRLPLSTEGMVGPHIPINQNFPGLKRVYTNPNIYVIENFLEPEFCRDMVEQASRKNMNQSPVAYAGWTEDFKDLFELSSKGPVVWLSLLGAWWQLKDNADATQIGLVQQALQNYAILLLVATAAIAAFTKSRADGLQSLRTSTSTTLDDMEASVGARKFVERTAFLLDNQPQQEASFFEAPTIIRYQAGQQLAPHFDANRSASIEDANRGGQTLATLLVYLNDVPQGGLTRFGRLLTSEQQILSIQPKLGDALLFFPADATGRFDDRTEHEGCAAVDEKWIARIWRHERQVPPPYGLSPTQLSKLQG